MGFGSDNFSKLDQKNLKLICQTQSVRVVFDKSFLLQSLLTYWGYLYSRQIINGEFITSSLQVQFGDETFGALQYAFFIVEFTKKMKKVTISQRPVYAL